MVSFAEGCGEAIRVLGSLGLVLVNSGTRNVLQLEEGDQEEADRRKRDSQAAPPSKKPDRLGIGDIFREPELELRSDLGKLNSNRCLCSILGSPKC